MTRDEVVELLRSRWRLTGQRFGEDSVDIWHEALGTIDYQPARRALIQVARDQKRIDFADLYQAARPRHEPLRLVKNENRARIMSPAEGRVVAYRECVAELVSRGMTEMDAHRRASELLKVWMPGA